MTTPPTPAEMPKPDLVRCADGKCFHCYEVTAEQPTTSIERFAAEQHARAERAEAELDDARQLIARDADEKIRLRELLRDTLPFIGPRKLVDRVCEALHPTTDSLGESATTKA